MAANFQDCRRLAMIARKHVKDDDVLEAMVLEMRDAVAGTTNKSVRETFERLVAEVKATRVPTRVLTPTSGPVTIKDGETILVKDFGPFTQE